MEENMLYYIEVTLKPELKDSLGEKTKKTLLRGVRIFSKDITTIHNFDITVFLVLYLNAGVPEIIAQVDSKEKSEALILLGVKRVVWPEKDIADREVTN